LWRRLPGDYYGWAMPKTPSASCRGAPPPDQKILRRRNMAVPKKRTSISKKNSRKSNWKKKIFGIYKSSLENEKRRKNSKIMISESQGEKLKVRGFRS